jgi:tetratricopeptide (TPR) repeat protein
MATQNQGVTRPTLPAMLRRNFALLIFLVSLQCHCAHAQTAGAPPSVAPLSNESANSTDEQKFLAEADKQYQGDRKKGSQTLSTRAWQLLRQGKSDEAMQRFNQARLLESKNGNALWGMGQIEANRGNAAQSLRLFGQANRLIGFDLDFAVDYARALSLAGAKLGDKKLLDEAFKRFAQIQERAPKHTLNLQNWAIAFYYTGQYAAAWDKIKAAQTTPRGAEVDKQFVADLQRKMPRP